jgi:putative transcription factor
MEHQQWEQVVWRKSATTQKVDKEKMVSKKSVEEKNSQMLDNATEATAIKKISQNISQQIIQGRGAKKMKRSQLAQAISEKESVIADYENGKAIVNQQILNKIGKVLGIKIKKN